MIDYLMKGYPPFMIFMTVLFVGILILTIRYFVIYVRPKLKYNKDNKRQLEYIKYLGIFSLTVGMLGQIFGLYNAFKAIQIWGSVSSDILFQGFSVSSITTTYGLIIFITSYLIYLYFKLSKKAESTNA